VPQRVAAAARRALAMKAAGFAGGQAMGLARGRQLAHQRTVDLATLRTMRAWFARHMHTSYPGYTRWVAAGRPMDREFKQHRGAVAILLWGGPAGHAWVTSARVTAALERDSS